jgi:hypothetical protein
MLTAVFSNIRDLNVFKNPQLRISCVDVPHPNPGHLGCSDKVDGKTIGGYAFSTGLLTQNSTIVLCDLFFSDGQQHLFGIEYDIGDKKEWQKDATLMPGKAKMLLHELTHLSAINGQFPSTLTIAINR